MRAGNAPAVLLENADDPNLRLLVRFYLYGYSLKELAKYYGKEVGAMKMRIRRAKKTNKKAPINRRKLC